MYTREKCSTKTNPEKGVKLKLMNRDVVSLTYGFPSTPLLSAVTTPVHLKVLFSSILHIPVCVCVCLWHVAESDSAEFITKPQTKRFPSASSENPENPLFFHLFWWIPSGSERLQPLTLCNMRLMDHHLIRVEGLRDPADPVRTANAGRVSWVHLVPGEGPDFRMYRNLPYFP